MDPYFCGTNFLNDQSAVNLWTYGMIKMRIAWDLYQLQRNENKKQFVEISLKSLV
jgi:hypothetical protein